MKSFAGSLLLFVCIALANDHAIGQRQWGINDSTFYQLNSDSTIIAARHKLYLKVQNNTSIVYDFTDPLDSTNFIRDFDFFDAQKWYVLVGSRFIGYTTMLYKTMDAGATWMIDSSYINRSDQNSLNQVQILDSNKVILFDGYYFSRLIYSEDKGHHWVFWFESPLAYYHGLFNCEGRYFLYGFEGDAFNNYMFEIPEWLFSQTEVLEFNSNCPGIINPDCFYAPSNISRLEAYYLFKAELEQVCDFSGIEKGFQEDVAGLIYPNPTGSLICFREMESVRNVQLMDINGTLLKIGMEQNCLDLQGIPNGVYFLKLSYSHKTIFRKIVRN